MDPTKSMVQAQIVERACVQLEEAQTPEQRAAAEKLLLQFRDSPSPFATCHYILNTSTNRNAQFHAAGALQEALLRDWSIMGHERTEQLEKGLMSFLFNRAATLDGVVKRQLLHVIGLMFKRGFFWGGEGDGKKTSDRFLGYVQQLVGDANIARKTMGCQLVVATFTEFSLTSSKTTGMGLPVNFHLRCHRCFEDYGLEQASQMLATLLCSLVQGSPLEAKQTPAFSSLVAAAVEGLSIAFGWEFGSGIFHCAIWGLTGSASTIRATAFCPPPSWEKVLFQTPLLSCLIQLYGETRQHGMDEQLQQCLMQYCSLTGRVFPNNDVGSERRKALMQAAWDGCWVQIFQRPLNDVDQFRAETHWAVKLLHRLVGNGKLEAVLQMERPGFFSDTLRLATQLLHVTPRDRERDIAWREETFDQMLAIWVIIVDSIKKLGGNVTVRQLLTAAAPAIKQSCLQLYMGHLQFRLKIAEMGYSKEHAERDVSAGILGRLNIERTLPSAATTLVMVRKELSEAAQAPPAAQPAQQPGGQSPHVRRLLQLQAKLFEAVQLFGNLLTEPTSQGEEIDTQEGFHLPDDVHPVIAQMRAAASQQCNDPVSAGVDAVLGACEVFCALMGNGTRPAAGDLDLSCVRGCVWLLTGFVKLFICPDVSKRHVAKVFGADYTFLEKSPHTARLVDRVVRVLGVLFKWLALAADSSAATKRQSLCSQTELLLRALTVSTISGALTASPAWTQLLADLCKNPKSYDAPGHPKMLVQLTLSLADQYSTQESPAGIQHLVSTIRNALPACLKDQTGASQAMVLSMVEGLAHTRLKGSDQHCGPFLLQTIPQLAKVMEAGGLPDKAVNRLLWIVAFTIETKFDVLAWPAEKVIGFCRFCTHLFRIYGPFNAKRAAAAAAQPTTSLNERFSQMAEQRGAAALQSQQADDLEALLELLSQLLYVTLSEECRRKAAAQTAAMVDAVLSMMDFLLPNLSETMFQYRDVCDGYFVAIQCLVNEYPQRYCSMPREKQQAMLRCVCFALAHPDAEVAVSGLRIIKSLATFYSTDNRPAEDLTHLMPGLLRALLLQPIPDSAINGYADALFVLILLDARQPGMPVYSAFATDTLQRVQQLHRVPTEENKHMVVNIKQAFAELIKDLTAAKVESVYAQTTFRASIRKFSREVRAWLKCN